MQTQRIEQLRIYNSATGRTRITLVTPADRPAGQPLRIAGTRWVAFGPEAAAELRALVGANTWRALKHKLARVGGFNADTWTTMSHHWHLEQGQTAAVAGCTFVNFGSHNSRILLVGPAPGRIEPQRVGRSSIITLSPTAHAAFAAYLASLPGDTGQAHYAAADVPGGLSAYTINKVRQYLGDISTSGKR